ncbi:MAG TPA: Do family serine endopeptidase [Lacunisphaera sp.]|jgi:serine protease Do|nr:Do family serine endopeptidase [Lacunisphaera sp.]
MNCRRSLSPVLLATLVFLPAGLAAKEPANAPLHLTIDRSPIDRDAPEHVSYAPVVDRTAGSIAFVYSTRQVRAQNVAPFLNDPVMRRFFGLPGPGEVPQEHTERGLGSGVVISADGYVLTNNHVVDGADDVKVAIGDSPERYDATIVGTDALADIAVLRIKAGGLHPATLGDSDQLKVGDVVLALGDPFGLGLSVSRGIVSAVGRGNLGIEQIEDFVQTDAAINMGNSGGALVDSKGRVVAINTAILSRTGGFAGVGFAIPINMARSVAEQIVATGQVRRGFLGVAPQALTPELAARFGTDKGALVAEVTPGSAAEKAGIKPGDVITRVNSVDVTDPRQLLLAVSQARPGAEVRIDYVRDGKRRTARAELAERPRQVAASGEGGGTGPAEKDTGVLNGVGVSDLTPDIRQSLQIPADIQGAVITQVAPDSPSAQQGLREGDVILEIEGRPVKSSADAVKRSEEVKGPGVMLRIWREGTSRYVVVDESKH